MRSSRRTGPRDDLVTDQPVELDRTATRRTVDHPHDQITAALFLLAWVGDAVRRCGHVVGPGANVLGVEGDRAVDCGAEVEVNLRTNTSRVAPADPVGPKVDSPNAAAVEVRIVGGTGDADLEPGPWEHTSVRGVDPSSVNRGEDQDASRFLRIFTPCSDSDMPCRSHRGHSDIQQHVTYPRPHGSRPPRSGSRWRGHSDTQQQQ